MCMPCEGPRQVLFVSQHLNNSFLGGGYIGIVIGQTDYIGISIGKYDKPGEGC